MSSTSAMADRRAGLRFDVRSLTLSSPPPNDGLTFAPNREGLTIAAGGTANPTLNGQALPFTRMTSREAWRSLRTPNASSLVRAFALSGVRRRGSAEMAVGEFETRSGR